MKKRITNLFGFLILLLGVIIFGLAVTRSQAGNKNSRAIVIGSKNFTESKIVMQIYADALSKNHYLVRTRPNISSSVVYQAVQSKQVDLYPEYTGTIAMTYLHENIVGKSAGQIAAIAKKGIAVKGLTLLHYAPGNDSQGLVITKKAAVKYHIKTLSDLRQKADKLRFISQGEFDQRPDGLVGLQKAYGPFRFKSHKLYDESLRYQLLDKNQGDVIPANTTEGQLASSKYLLLKDNKHFWPAYNLVPVVRQPILNRYPEIRLILNRCDRKLTTKELTLLNKRVDVDGESYQKVAQEWVKRNYQVK